MSRLSCCLCVDDWLKRGGISLGFSSIRFSTNNIEDQNQDKHFVTVSADSDDLLSGILKWPLIYRFTDDINVEGKIQFLRLPDEDKITIRANVGQLYSIGESY